MGVDLQLAVKTKKLREEKRVGKEYIHTKLHFETF